MANEEKSWIKSTGYEGIITRLVVPKFQTYGHAMHLLMIQVSLPAKTESGLIYEVFIFILSIQYQHYVAGYPCLSSWIMLVGLPESM